MRNLLLICLLLLSYASLIGQRTMSAQEALRFKEKVMQSASNIETISSEFVQIKHLDFLENDIESTGVMAFQSPNSLKWAYTSPTPFSIIFKGNDLYVNKNGKQSKMNMGGSEFLQSLNELISKSIRGDMFDEDKFDIQYFYTSTAEAMVAFEPKSEDMGTFIERFQLSFDIKTAQVTAVKMIEASEDYTQIIFKNKKINTTLDQATFKTEN